MNREDCEKIILEKMKDIAAIYHEYNPEGNYLTLVYIKDKTGEYIDFSNRYYRGDEEHPIDYNTISGSRDHG